MTHKERTIWLRFLWNPLSDCEDTIHDRLLKDHGIEYPTEVLRPLRDVVESLEVLVNPLEDRKGEEDAI